MIYLKFNTRIKKAGKKYEIPIPSTLISIFGLHEGEVLELTVNSKDIIVEKSVQSKDGEDIVYPKIVFSNS